MFYNFPVSRTRPKKIVWFESHASQVGLHHRYPWSHKQQNRYCVSKYYHLPSTVKRESFSHMFIFQTRQFPNQLCRQDQMKMFHLEHETMNVCQRNVEHFVQMECRFDKIKDIFQGFGNLVSLWLQKDGGAKSKQIWMNLSDWNTGSSSSCCEESLIFFYSLCKHSARETWHSYHCHLLLHSDRVSLCETWLAFHFSIWRCSHWGQLFLAQKYPKISKFRLKILLMFSPYVTFDVMKLGNYVIVDNSSNYVMFHELNVRMKVKKIITPHNKSLGLLCSSVKGSSNLPAPFNRILT